MLNPISFPRPPLSWKARRSPSATQECCRPPGWLAQKNRCSRAVTLWIRWIAAIISPFLKHSTIQLSCLHGDLNKAKCCHVLLTSKQANKTKPKSAFSRPSLATSLSSNPGGAHNPHLLCHVPRPSTPHPQCLAWPALNLYLVEHA